MCGKMNAQNVNWGSSLCWAVGMKHVTSKDNLWCSTACSTWVVAPLMVLLLKLLLCKQKVGSPAPDAAVQLSPLLFFAVLALA